MFICQKIMLSQPIEMCTQFTSTQMRHIFPTKRRNILNDTEKFSQHNREIFSTQERNIINTTKKYYQHNKEICSTKQRHILMIHGQHIEMYTQFSFAQICIQFMCSSQNTIYMSRHAAGYMKMGHIAVKYSTGWEIYMSWHAAEDLKMFCTQTIS